jgi:hypothetical protein
MVREESKEEPKKPKMARDNQLKMNAAWKELTKHQEQYHPEIKIDEDENVISVNEVFIRKESDPDWFKENMQAPLDVAKKELTRFMDGHVKLEGKVLQQVDKLLMAQNFDYKKEMAETHKKIPTLLTLDVYKEKIESCRIPCNNPGFNPEPGPTDVSDCAVLALNYAF